jgi:DNA-binding response OmpR family regulator
MAPQPARSSQRVLLVEDHADTSEAFAGLIEDQGYHVSRADTLQQAKQLCAGTHFDILLCDIALPDGSGLELPQWLKLHHRQTRIIAVTAMGMADEVTAMRRAGFDLILLKPISAETLFAALNRIDASTSDGGYGSAWAG